MSLPEIFCLLLHLESDFVTASSLLLMLHRADHSGKALDALNQRILIFPLVLCE
jgi:hypothetical protein